jgi:uncharacterized membrane protein YfcA
MDADNVLLLSAIGVISFVLSFLGAAVGLILGHLRLPLLIYCLPSTAAGMATNLFISGLGALSGTVRHVHGGRLSWKLILLMGLPSIAGAFLGAVLLLKIDSAAVRLVLGAFLVISGVKLFRCQPADSQAALVFGKLRAMAEVGIGLAIGFLAAVTGLMLGSLRLPLMIRCLKIDPRVAVGTNMAIGCLTALAGAVVMWSQGKNFHILPLLIIAPPTILGGYLGAHFTGRFQKEALQRLVGATVAIAGLGMAAEGIWKNVPHPIHAREVHEVATLPASYVQEISFNRDIRPILSNYCFACHGPDGHRRKAGLRLDRRAAAIAELSTGKRAIVPGDRWRSELYIRIAGHEPGRTMPPRKTGKSLSPEQIALLGKWIDQGAKYDPHWAYVPPTRPMLPIVADKTWPRNEIDYFVLQRLDREGLKPSPEADRATLIRRLSFDLIGMPPSPAEVEAFLADRGPHAYEKLVERLLSSPQYGERMAQHWLDLARYADTNGYRLDNHRDMWPYRDWVIAAFNRNMPFDQFTVEQLAGDLLPGGDVSRKVATGFHRNTMVNFGNGSDPREYLAKAVMDRVSTTATVWLGATLACAQCHDHKFDPFTQKDFYRFYAFFNNVPEKGLDGEHGSPGPTLALPSPEQIRCLADLEARLESLRGCGESSDECRRLMKAKAELLSAIPTAMVMQEMDKPRVTRIMIRGDYLNEGEVVTPGVPEQLLPMPRDLPANRLGLARWLVDPDHPVTSRVTVNRFWQMLFGMGLVRTSDDFGSQGELPSHPELLDWLATEFVARQWDVKSMLRLIVTSATYRQSSSLTPALREKDPENRLLARGARFRLDAEMIRDQALAVSGLLHRTIGGPSVCPPQPAGLWEQVAVGGNYSSQSYVRSTGPEQYRRGIYTYWKRSLPYPALALFDAPAREACTAARPRTNTPLQALVLLNDEVYVEAGRGLAQRILRERSKDIERLNYGFELCTSRRPTSQEMQILSRVLQEQRALYRHDRAAARKLVQVGDAGIPGGLDAAELAAWTAVGNMLLNLDETMTRE